MIMKSTFLNLTVMALAISTLSSAALATEVGTWLVRSRAIYIAPMTSTDGVGSTAALPIDVRSEGTPEFDFTYFFAKNVSAELILAMARHSITLGGQTIGAENVLPPTLSVQYHFQDLLGIGFDPYLGAGINYTIFFNQAISTSGTGSLTTSKSSFGPSFQAGADIPIKGDIFLNIDAKKILMKADVLSGTTTLNTLHINPWVFGLGIGFKI